MDQLQRQHRHRQGYHRVPYPLIGLIVCIIPFLLLSTHRAAIAQLPTQAISLGAGRALQLIDPAGYNTFPLWTTGDGPIDFTLHPLEPASFVTRYSHTSPYNPPLLDVTDTPATVQWQQQFTTTATATVRTVHLPTAPEIAARASGLYILRAITPQQEEATALVVISPYMLLAKRGVGGQFTIWATELQKRAPISRMTITLYDQAGTALSQGTTDSNGSVTFQLTTTMPQMAVGEIMTEAGLATTATGLDWQWRDQEMPWFWHEPTTEEYRTYLHTDRPLYRPGQSIYYQALLRHNLASGYGLPDPSVPVTVELFDSRGNLVDSVEPHADAFGAIDGAFRLSEEPPLGGYQLAVTVAGERTAQAVQVETYRKAEYAVNVTSAAPFVISGDSLSINVDATYFFGQPVANAAVEVKLYRARRDSGWDALWRDETSSDLTEEPSQRFTGKTDSQGRWQTTIMPTADALHDTRYTIVAAVTDERAVPQTGVAQIDSYRHTLALSAQSDRYGYGSDEAVAIQVRTRAHDGTPQSGKAVTLRLVQPAYSDHAERDIVPPQQLVTAADGNATATFPPLPPGWYRILAHTLDDRAQPVNAESYLWISTMGSDAQGQGEEQTLTIMADRSSYVPGDVAQLLIKSPVTGTALLALERAGVHTEQLVPINGALTTVEVPITDAFVPNIFAQIHLFAPTAAADQPTGQNEGTLLTAQTELTVEATTQKLLVTVTGDAQAYEPGAPAEVTIQVTDQQGVPVHARVALALVDEAIFSLQADRAAPLFHYFYGAAPHQVATFHSLARQTVQWYTPIIEDRDGEPPLDSIDEENGLYQSRHNFQDTAYWNPQIETDANGQASVTIILPDNLTTWRVMARAITKATAVGESQSTLLVTKALIARPLLPRFALLGDQFHSSAIAQNFTDAQTTGQIELTAPHFTILEPPTEQVDLQPGGSALSQWTTVASQLGRGLVTTTLTTAAGQDQVVSTVTINPFAVPERWTAAGIAAPMATESFTLPFNAINDATTLTVQLSPSLALGMLDGLADLIDYPYGCVEQTMSRILPSAVAAHAFTQLGVVNPKADELPTILAEGVQKLYGFQHNDGSWGWFYDDDGGLYLTAYVLFGLTQVEAAGTPIDQAVLTRGFTYLDRALATVDDANSKAYALYVKAVAGRGDLAQAQALVEVRDTLASAALAALALALQEQGDQHNAQLVIDTLLQQVHEGETTAYWPLPTTEWNWSQWQRMASAEKNSALALQALLVIEPDHPLLPKVVRWLMQAREGASWHNTQATAQAILGLIDYSQLHHELDATYTYRVLLNETELMAGTVSPETHRLPIKPLILPGTAIQSGLNRLTIERSSAVAPLYYSMHLEQSSFYDRYNPATAVEHGMQVTRSYQLIEGSPRGDGAYNVGDLIEVTVDLAVKERMAYVLVEDPIPAGFEPINERLNPVSYGGDPLSIWQELGYNRKNIREDRVDFFITTLEPGQTTLTYLMRATLPGLFGVPPGQAYPMYKDNIWGRSAGLVVRVAPELLAQRPPLRGDFDGDCKISHFDAQLVAGAWGTKSIERNLIADAQIDLKDIAAVVERVGATCLQDQNVPTNTDEQMALVAMIDESHYALGRPITVTIRPSQFTPAGQAIGPLGGYGIQLHFDPAMLEIAAVQWHQQETETLPLGPQINRTEGIIQLGAYGFFKQQAKMEEALATVIFVGKAAGSTKITAIAGEAVDEEGRPLATVVSTSEGSITISGQQLFLPIVQR